MQRKVEIDALRGLMLVWITMTHLPTPLSPYVNQPIGFLSAAEGFIFLSALFTGLIYSRMAGREGFRVTTTKLWSRARRLYVYHALLVAGGFFFWAQVAAAGNRPGLHNLLDYYFAVGPKHALIDAALLIYRPPLLDILPMYIIFLALTPIALVVASRVGWKYIVGGGFLLWVLAQFGLSERLYAVAADLFSVKIPINEMGAFDVWAWQFCWIVGLWCGVRWAANDLPLEQWAKRLTIPAIVLASVFFLWRLGVASDHIDIGRLEPLVDKWHLGVVRLFDFVSVAVILVRLQSVLKPLAIRPLVMLGQASLQVFCVHLVFVFLGLAMMGDAAFLNGWRVVFLIALTMAALLITAKVFEKNKTNRPRGAVLPPAPALRPPARNVA